jgi:hypothetical protein
MYQIQSLLGTLSTMYLIYPGHYSPLYAFVSRLADLVII